MNIEFTKMHGSGNDFIVIDEFKQELVPEGEKKEFVASICDRHFGIGADGVIFVKPSEREDAWFHFFNPDGTIAEMCGNGIRCFAKYLYEKKLVETEEIRAETLAGVKTLNLEVEGGKVNNVKVSMGPPQVTRASAQMSGEPAGEPVIDEEIVVDGFEFMITQVGMGNPHTILAVDDVESVRVRDTGKLIRHSQHFPNGTNVHFIQKTGENEYKIRTYERGVEAETLACGTGICASAVASVLLGESDKFAPILFHARGGDITVEFSIKDDKIANVFLIGPAVEVFSGSLDY